MTEILGQNPLALVAVITFLVVSLGIHEAAHAWVALKCGDPTGRDMGRITLNPIPHIDPFMTLILPVVLFLTTGWIFGGAKPVPVAFHRLRHPWRDMSLVAIAGPASNFVLACLFLLAYRLSVVLLGLQPIGGNETQVLPVVFYFATFYNLVLAAFNLIPIPPLDGSRVMAWLLPDDIRPAYLRLEPVGILIVFALLWFGPLRGVIWDAIDGMMVAAWYIVSLGGVW
jgi:Zn-dependent protease